MVFIINHYNGIAPVKHRADDIYIAVGTDTLRIRINHVDNYRRGIIARSYSTVRSVVEDGIAYRNSDISILRKIYRRLSNIFAKGGGNCRHGINRICHVLCICINLALRSKCRCKGQEINHQAYKQGHGNQLLNFHIILLI